MLIVNQGLEGPRAIALQILLNRAGGEGTPVKVDGHYGTQTSQAVEGYRKDVLKVPGQGSVADLPFWQAIMRINRLQTVEAVDVTDPLLDSTVAVLEQNQARPIQLAGTSNGIPQLMRLIKAEAKSDGSVMLLRFHAHGGPGVVAISHGNRKISAGIDPMLELSVLNAITIGKLGPELASIAPVFADFGFVEFHACRVAEGAKGAEMLQQLANLWKVPVTAPLTRQNAETATFKASGATQTYYPGGVSMRQWAEARVEAKRPVKQGIPGTPLLVPVYADGVCTTAPQP